MNLYNISDKAELKKAINSVHGITSASFENPFPGYKCNPADHEKYVYVNPDIFEHHEIKDIPSFVKGIGEF